MADIPQYVRSGVRPYPWEDKAEGVHSQDIDEDGHIEGVHSQDIDEDGHILTMRIPDSNGDWKVSSLDTRLMERRGPDEHGGQYYRLLPEGYLIDYDGYQIKIARPHSGLDFNRNFPVERPSAQRPGFQPQFSS